MHDERTTYYAHTLEDATGHKAPPDRWQPLRDHLEAVGELAARFASSFGAEEWGRVAGLWHDLGKYRPGFQDYLHGRRASVPHSAVGAVWAQRRKGNHDAWLPLAFAIAGHHAGLADLLKQEGGGPQALLPRLEHADTQTGLGEARPHVPADLLDRPLPDLPERFRLAKGSPPEKLRAKRQLALWIRLLFSTLVDADFLDTERFYRGDDRDRATRGFLAILELRRRLDDHVDRLAAGARDTEVNRVRREVLEAARSAADWAPGLFSMSVPTGGGKTLASMSFALRHAERHGLRRVVVVIPLTSILEQNAAVYRRALGDEQVIEHHSNLDPQKETRRNKLASENWDAPVVVTTAVQLFESLFAHRTSRCRKLHNLVGSVIVLDEAQTLPPEFLKPILEVLDELARSYGCSVVLSTATQPALARRDALPQGLEGVREMMSDPAALARRLVRFRPEWRGAVEWDELAAEVGAHHRVLAVVHKRRDARDLALRLPEKDTYHLSALMCAAHRLKVLERVKALLKDTDRPCRLVSTQLVEAGVDISFPVVYRALAGIDSLLQAGGRCNREGESDLGRLIVYRAPTEPPPGTPRKGAETTATMLARDGEGLDLFDPKTVEDFFKGLYFQCELDRHGILGELAGFNFARVSALFRLIQDDYTQPLVVPYGDGPARLERFRAAGPTREGLRSLQPFVINVPIWDLEALEKLNAIDVVHGSVASLVPSFSRLYDGAYGFVFDRENPPAPEALIV